MNICFFFFLVGEYLVYLSVDTIILTFLSMGKDGKWSSGFVNIPFVIVADLIAIAKVTQLLINFLGMLIAGFPWGH